MGPTSVLQSDRALNLFTRLIFTKIPYQTQSDNEKFIEIHNFEN